MCKTYVSIPVSVDPCIQGVTTTVAVHLQSQHNHNTVTTQSPHSHHTVTTQSQSHTVTTQSQG